MKILKKIFITYYQYNCPGLLVGVVLSRPDVDKAYPGHGPNHGFAANIKTKKTGVVDVYMYAIQRTRPDLPNPHIGTIKVDLSKA